MSTHNIFFRGEIFEIRKILWICYPLISKAMMFLDLDKEADAVLMSK